MQNSYITAGVSANTNYIKIYDDRTAEKKGAGALCSMRMRYQIIYYYYYYCVCVCVFYIYKKSHFYCAFLTF